MFWIRHCLEAWGESLTTRFIPRVAGSRLPGQFAARPHLLSAARIVISVFLFSLFLSSTAPEEKRISIYSKVASYSLPVVDQGGQEYTGLLEVLEPLGTVSAKADNKHWKLRYNDNDLDFTVEKTRVRMKRGDFDLSSPFVMQNGRGLVPISDLGAVLSRILGGPVTFNPASHRIFIGNVAVHFTAQISATQSPATTPPTLIMNFSAPVNPAIATDAGKLQMTFNHDPIVPPGTQTLTFNNQVISSAIYRDGNGSAEITIVGATPLFARFSTDHKTITITAAPLATAQGGALPSQTGGTAAPATQTHENSASQPYFAVVDASHGGEDRGAALTGQLAEKDITLAFALRLREELQAHGVNTLLLRNGDTNLSPDQRAGMANAAHPAIYLCVHAASQGHGVNLYTALLPDDTETHGPFRDWETAQVSSLARSQFAAAILAKTLEDSKIQVRKLSALLRPLNNITTAAIAVEIAPPAGGASGLSSVEYQQAMASSIANGVAAVREKMGSIP